MAKLIEAASGMSGEAKLAAWAQIRMAKRERAEAERAALGRHRGTRDHECEGEHIHG